MRQNDDDIYTVSQKKTSHFNFRHNFAICWDIFTIFEAFCSGIIVGWCNLLHTHHRCEAFTWRDVTHDVIQAAVHTDAGFHTTWLMVSKLTGLKSCWLFFLEYHAREGVPDTHSEYRWVETSASWGVGGAGPQTSLQLGLSDRGDAVSMRVTRVWKLRGIFWPTFALNFHVALWTICWIAGLCNIWHLTLLPADFECFVSYYSRFCAFCEPHSFNSSYYHINKPLRIYATLCHAWIIPEQNVSKIVKISQQMAKLWRKLKWLVFFWDTV